VLPDFLCIGAMKAGTSWLYHNIQYHPDVQMPPYKEIFHFHDPSAWPTITWVFLSRNPARRLRASRVLTYYMPRRMKHAPWFLRYLLLPRTDKWYASLFSRDKGKIAGDVTPTYARLKRGRVARIHALMPDAKIIYFLRNPIQRTWSQVAMHFENWRQGLENANDGAVTEFLERLERKGDFKDSDYLRALRTWGEFYPEHQFHVAFLDELVQNPRTFTQGIYRFLGLDASDQFVPREVHKKRNARQYPPMPEHVARYLAGQHYERIEELHQRFDNSYTAGWLEFAEQYL